MKKYTNILFAIVFFALIAFSISVSYQHLLVSRQYQIFTTEDQVDAASENLVDLATRLISL